MLVLTFTLTSEITVLQNHTINAWHDARVRFIVMVSQWDRETTYVQHTAEDCPARSYGYALRQRWL